MKKEEIVSRLETAEQEILKLKTLLDERNEDVKNLPIKERCNTYQKCYDDVVSRYDTLPNWLIDLINTYKNANSVPMWLRVYIIVNALNGGRLIQRGQKRYYAWFKEDDKLGWGFDCSSCHHVDSMAGSRLDIYSEESMPKFYADNFKEEINAHMPAD